LKLRIKENSIRFRITRSELARILEGERLRDRIQFAATPEAILGYTLGITDQDTPVRVDYARQTVNVGISRDAVNAWAKESEVGVYSTVPISENLGLDVIIEKDFACLDRNDAENADTFSNPHAHKRC
jgi:hypothetical protein